MLNKNLFFYVSLLCALFLFYIITPILLAIFDYEIGGYMLHGYVYSDEEISYILSLIDIFISQYYFLIIILTFSLILFFTNFIFANSITNSTNDVETKNINKVILILIFPCFFMLILDLLEIYIYTKHVDYNQSLSRDAIYHLLLDKRKTYINILIILTPIIFNSHKKISILIYLSILLYSVLTLSRFELFLLFVVHVILNIKFSYRNFLIIVFFVFLIIIMRTFITYDIQFNTTFFWMVFDQVIIETIHVFLSNLTAFTYVKTISFTEYLRENVLFLGNNLFYQNYETINLSKQTILYFQNSQNYLRNYSVSGFSTILIYFPIFILEISFLYFLSKKILSPRVFIAFFVFLSLFWFRGHFIHVCLFLVKLSLLMLFILWIIKKLQMSNFKVE